LNVEKNIKIQEAEKQLKDANVKIMVSQIQPHFIYNTLSSISTLITLDPNKAKVALDDFTEYLRMNLTSLTDTRLIPFEKELKHIETYVFLEKMRFNDRLTVKYDIKAKDFEVPPLSIQPLVENAIKHGILQKLEGGELVVKSYETDDAYVVEVIDNGVGFDMNSDDFNNGDHVGLNNIKVRLTTMCKGELKYDSKVNEGTKVVVKFFK
jgi:LytS/YehU family sensor histidine kinase